MLFNSYPFVFFYLPIVFAGMFVIGHWNQRLAALWLCLASLAFYAVWDARYLILLLGSIAFNYAAGFWMGSRLSAGKAGAARAMLIFAISGDLALLGYFKYTNFFLSSANELFSTQFPVFDIILPLGISFFTFTQIAFLVDVYRGIAKEYNFINYALFVTYFPHLIAGPVLHYKQMMPQFADPATYKMKLPLVGAGLTIFIIGLAKKVLIADLIAPYATAIFSAAADGSALMLVEAWMGALAYALQLYFDFSGYCDMAIGMSLMLNIRLPLNFNSPYKATSIIDFWRRWNMTLSTFLRDYLYIPLGGNRKGPVRRYANLLITMLIGGLWHGAGWTFVIWGGLHGVYLIVNHGWENLTSGWKSRLPAWIISLGAGGLTFASVVAAWTVFRAPDLATAGTMLKGMCGGAGISLPAVLEKPMAPLVAHFPHFFAFKGFQPVTERAAEIIPYVLIGLAIVWLLPNTQQIFQAFRPVWENEAGRPSLSPLGPRAGWLGWRLTPLRAVLAGLVFYFCLIHMTGSRVSEFLYFQF